MRIAIDARLLKPKPDDGISRFTWEVVKRLVYDHPGHQYILVFDKEHKGLFTLPSNTTSYVQKPASRHPVLWYTWHEWQLPRVLRKSNADILFSPDGIIPLNTPIPCVPVIHDINFFHRPGDIPYITSLYYRHFFVKFARKARRVLTVSEFCRQDISENMGIDPSLIDVAHNGVSEYFVPFPDVEKAAFREKHTGGQPYFLFVGNFSPRKNIPGLINAYNIFRERGGAGIKLVLTGGRLFLNSETDRLINSSPYKHDIILTGSFSHSDLAILYASAEALVFVPWFEGFGIPAAEAMRCGTPVILSDTTSLPEVGGKAALYASPSDPSSVADCMLKIISDSELRERLIAEGYLQSARFTWDNTANQVMKSIEKAFL